MATIIDDLLRDRLKILFMSPERLASAAFRRLLRPKRNTETNTYERQLPKVSLLCVDEAHCLSQVDDLHDRLPGILSQCDALLSSPDPVIYNNGSIRNILLTAYKYKTPVIGYSKAFVKAGALMALYTSPKQLGTEVGEILIGLSDTPTQSLPEPKSPKYFSIEFNYWVAQALKLELPDKEALIKTLSRDFNKTH